MQQITARALRQAEWKLIYTYDGAGYGFTTYASDRLPGLTITKERRGSKRVRINTIYQFNGRKTDSPTQAVRMWNEAARAAKSGRRPTPGSPKQARSTSRDAGL